MTPASSEASDRRRRELEARDRLCEALYRGRRRDVAWWLPQLERLLGAGAASDPDVVVVRGWLEEQIEVEVRRRERSRRVRLKLVLTGAPLILATFLASLLTAVLWLSG